VRYNINTHYVKSDRSDELSSNCPMTVLHTGLNRLELPHICDGLSIPRSHKLAPFHHILQGVSDKILLKSFGDAMTINKYRFLFVCLLQEMNVFIKSTHIDSDLKPGWAYYCPKNLPTCHNCFQVKWFNGHYFNLNFKNFCRESETGRNYPSGPDVGTLAAWAVTFGTARRGLGGLRPRPVLASLYQM